MFDGKYWRLDVISKLREPKERGGGGRGVGASYNLNIKTLWRIGDREAGHERKVVSEKGKNCSRHGFLHQRMNANGSDTK
jgi:hypothetical protein